MEANTEDEPRLFELYAMKGREAMDTNWNRKFCLNVSKNFYSVKVTEHGNWQLIEVSQFSWGAIFEIQHDAIVAETFLSGSLRDKKKNLDVLSNLNSSVILCDHRKMH